MNEKLPFDGDDFKADQLERFIDGLMSDKEAEEFLEMTDNAELAIAERDLQFKIDDALRRSFGFSDVEKETLVRSAQLELLLSPPAGEVESQTTLSQLGSLRESPLFKLAIAASLLFAICIGTWMFGGFGRQITPHFNARPVAKIYNETVERGFRPYYNCEDDQRFADTFEFRQGIPLALADLPEGSRMLGLSYLGGISRDTTAMLAEVDGKKVMVFVDVAANRHGLEVAAVSSAPDLNVFVVQRDGLVFCEVTPHEKSTLIEYFERVE